MPKQVIARNQIENKYQYLTLRWTKDDESSVQLTIDETEEFDRCESNDGPRHLDWHDDCLSPATTTYYEDDSDYEFSLCDYHARRYHLTENYLIIEGAWNEFNTHTISTINMTRKEANFLIKQMRNTRDQVFGVDQ